MHNQQHNGACVTTMSKEQAWRRKWALVGNFLIFGLITLISGIIGIFYYPSECSTNADCSNSDCDTVSHRCSCTAADFAFIPPRRPAYCDPTESRVLLNIPWVIALLAFVTGIFLHILFDFMFDGVDDASGLHKRIKELKRQVDRLEKRIEHMGHSE